MKNISGKKISTIAVGVVTCVVLGLAIFILLREDKPVYTPAVNTHQLETNAEGYTDNYSFVEFEVGPDVAGNKYRVVVSYTEINDEGGATFISINDGKKQKVVDDDNYSGYFWNAISMIDDNGKAIIVVNMDIMSDDYVFVMYTIEDGKLIRCGSDYAFVTEAETDRTFTAEYRVNFFGSWYGERTVKLTSSNRVQLQDGDYLLQSVEERKLTAQKNIKVSLADENGKYKSATLKKGSVISLYATDGESYVLFTTEDGTKGKLEASFKDGYTLIKGKEDFNLFDGIMYAG